MRNAIVRTGIVLAVLVLVPVQADRSLATEEQDPGRLDLARMKIESDSVREFLKAESIAVRNRETRYVPEGSLPVLRMEAVTDEACRSRLPELFHKLAGPEEKAGRVKEKSGMYVIQGSEYSIWMSRASGAYGFTKKRDENVGPTRVGHFKEAVRIALDYLAEKRLVDLIADEEIDLLVVSQLRNAVVVVEKTEFPKDVFVSDHYVRFGRRYRGVPVIGSHVTMRIDSRGEVVMVDKTWRRIEGIEEKPAEVVRKPVPERLLADPRFREIYDRRKISPEDIIVRSVRSGYMEAPLNYRQSTLRPGISVGFTVGEAEEEMPNLLVMALEEDIDLDDLWGRNTLAER